MKKRIAFAILVLLSIAGVGLAKMINEYTNLPSPAGTELLLVDNGTTYRNHTLDQFSAWLTVGNRVSHYGGSLSAAVLSLGYVNPATLLVDNDITVSTTTVIPANITLVVPPGSVITINSGISLTITGPFVPNTGQVFAGTGTALVSDINVSKMRPEHWGAGTTADDATAVQAFCTCVTTGRTAASTIKFTPGAHYTLASGINFQMFANATVDAEGVYFTFTNNGQGFDLNPALSAVMPVSNEADTYTLRNVRWKGGHFNNTNATKTASYAIRAYYMRGFELSGARFGDDSGGFYNAVLIGGKDTYDIANNFFASNVNAISVPVTGTIYVHPGYGGNKLLDTRIHKNHIQTASAQTGIKVSDGVMNFSIIDNTFAGNTATYPTIAHVHFLEGTAGSAGENVSAGIQIQNNKFEQMSQNATSDTPHPAVYFDGTTVGDGFYSVDFNGNSFNAGGQRKGYVYLSRVHGAKFGTNYFWPGSGVLIPKYGVYIASTCDDVQFDRSTTFTNFMYNWVVAGTADNGAGLVRLTLTATDHYLYAGDRVWVYNVGGTVEANGMWTVQRVSGTQVDLVGSAYATPWSSGGTLVHMNAIVLGSTATRPKITMLPEVVPLTTSVNLTNYSNTPKSDQTNTQIEMDKEFNFFLSTGNPAVTRYLWPRGYFLTLVGSDTKSKYTTTWSSLKKNAAAVAYSGIYLGLTGNDNGTARAVSGLVPAADNGTIRISVEASGSNTHNSTIAVTGIYQ
jgi:hypothetical protein